MAVLTSLAACSLVMALLNCDRTVATMTRQSWLPHQSSLARELDVHQHHHQVSAQFTEHSYGCIGTLLGSTIDRHAKQLQGERCRNQKNVLILHVGGHASRSFCALVGVDRCSETVFSQEGSFAEHADTRFVTFRMADQLALSLLALTYSSIGVERVATLLSLSHFWPCCATLLARLH